MTNRIYSYLRASTNEQDATRAKSQLEKFAASYGRTIAAPFVENISGAKLERPALMQLIEVAQPGDVLLIEAVDRLTRLDEADWNKLIATIDAKELAIVSLDLAMTYDAMKEPIRAADLDPAEASAREFHRRLIKGQTRMMLETLAAVARKDYADRRRRQAQGIASAQQDSSKYKGRPVDEAKRAHIAKLLDGGMTQREIHRKHGYSPVTISRVAKEERARHAETAAEFSKLDKDK
ncbi:recombinase family protein [Citrobacter sp. Cpo107]|uniref:recombinase family protein n=1 Tax=Citrobacter TaxID=544 RepID=UPI002574A1D9|nr:recombinase family protein [Citrobacter sp. Cpo107]MDM2807629.1 recombinase family protein [Citrobacter sp. Cpo107]